jgi:hypothetical protein
MAELNAAPAVSALAHPESKAVGRITEIVVRLEVDAAAARALLHIAELAGTQPRMIVTYQGEPLGEIVPVSDPERLERLRSRLASLEVADVARAPALAVDPEVLLPDKGWQQEWDTLRRQAESEIPEGSTPEQVEQAISRAAAEARSERLARRG